MSDDMVNTLCSDCIVMQTIEGATPISDFKYYLMVNKYE